jgi:hypothetical protein
MQSAAERRTSILGRIEIVDAVLQSGVRVAALLKIIVGTIASVPPGPLQATPARVAGDPFHSRVPHIANVRAFNAL